MLGNNDATVFYAETAEVKPTAQVESLQRLVADMRDGKVELLVIIGGNPSYDAPADCDFAGALKQVKHAVHLGLSRNETSDDCEWHVPQTHFLEAWGDIRSFDGTVTIQQPLITPLFGGRSELELLAVMEKMQPQSNGHEKVQNFWRSQNRWVDFENGWRKALQDGIIEGTSFRPKTVTLAAQKSESPTTIQGPTKAESELEVLFR